MSFSRVVKVIGEIEKNFDVNSLCYKNLCVWPIVRAYLVNRLCRPELYPAKRKPADQYSASSIWPDQQQLAEMGRYKNVDFMFISLPGECWLKVEGKYYNIRMDPYIEAIKDKHSFLKIGQLSSTDQSALPRYVPTVFLQSTYSNFFYPVDKGQIVNFDTFQKYLLPGLLNSYRTVV